MWKILTFCLFFHGINSQYSNFKSYLGSGYLQTGLYGTGGGFGLGNPLTSLGGYHNNINHNVPFVTPTTGSQYQNVTKLAGRNVFTTAGTTEYPPGVHGLAVTITQSSNILGGSIFGDSYYGHYGGLGGSSLALNLQVQTSKPGYYQVVFTSLGKARDGCTVNTLGGILDYSSPYGISQPGSYGRPGSLPNGVIGDFNLGRNIPKTLDIRRLAGITKLKDLAGRGVAVCEASGPNSPSRPCRGAIVACTALHYTGTDEELGFLQLPSYQPPPPPPPPQPTNPVPGRSTGSAPSAVRQANNQNRNQIKALGSETLPKDEYYSSLAESERVYYGIDTEPYYDSDMEMLDMYTPPQPPPLANYDPFSYDADREPVYDRPIVIRYGSDGSMEADSRYIRTG